MRRLNHIAYNIYAAFEENFPGDDYYLGEKWEYLIRTNKFSALVYMNNLDGTMLSSVAERLGVPAYELRRVSSFLRDL